MDYINFAAARAASADATYNEAAILWLEEESMNKLFSFMAGALCGTLVGAVAGLLLTPASGEELRMQAQARWDAAMTEAELARMQTRQRLETEFQQLTNVKL